MLKNNEILIFCYLIDCYQLSNFGIVVACSHSKHNVSSQ